MHEIGLKLWNINTDYYFDEAKKLYNDNIFDYIELYIVPGHTDKIDKWLTLNIPFDIHAPHYAHNMNLSKPEYFDENLKKYKEVKEYADRLKAEVIVFHGGSGGDYKETARQIKLFDDSRIIIENKPYDTLKFVDADYYVGSKYNELRYIIDYSNCGFCLDIGHAVCAANSQGIEPYEYIEKLITLKPKRVHLSDIHLDTKFDEHLNYGDGDLDFEKIIKMLPFDINITIETKKKEKTNLFDYKNDSIFLKRIIENQYEI